MQINVRKIQNGWIVEAGYGSTSARYYESLGEFENIFKEVIEESYGNSGVKYGGTVPSQLGSEKYGPTDTGPKAPSKEDIEEAFNEPTEESPDKGLNTDCKTGSYVEAHKLSLAGEDETAKIRRDRIKKALSFTDFTDNGRQSTDYYEKKLKEILDAQGLNTDHIVIETKKKAAPKPAPVETPQPTAPAEPTDKPATIAKLNEVGKAHMQKFDYDRTKKILAKYSGNPNMVKTSEIPVEKRNACMAELQGEIDNG